MPKFETEVWNDAQMHTNKWYTAPLHCEFGILLVLLTPEEARAAFHWPKKKRCTEKLHAKGDWLLFQEYTAPLHYTRIGPHIWKLFISPFLLYFFYVGLASDS